MSPKWDAICFLGVCILLAAVIIAATVPENCI